MVLPRALRYHTCALKSYATAMNNAVTRAPSPTLGPGAGGAASRAGVGVRGSAASRGQLVLSTATSGSLGKRGGTAATAAATVAVV